MRQVLEREQVKIGKICARKREERTLFERKLRMLGNNSLKVAKRGERAWGGPLGGKGTISGPDSGKLGKMLRARGPG